MEPALSAWTVAEWMSRPVFTVPPDMSVREGFITMRLKGFRHLLVAREGKLIGIVSDRDLRRPDVSPEDPEGWDDFYQLDEDYEVCDVMQTDVVTVQPHTPLSEAVRLFVQYKFHALPVVDSEGRPVGILTSHDVFRAFLKVFQSHS